MRRFFYGFLTFFLIAAFLPSTVFASSVHDGRVILGNSYTLKVDETLDGALIVIGGTATLEEGSTVSGNIVILGGSFVSYGEVLGNITIIGSSVKLAEKSIIDGNLVLVASNFDQQTGAIIHGNVQQLFSGRTIEIIHGKNPIPRVIPGLPQIDVHPLISASKIGLRSFIAAIFAILLALVFPKMMGRTLRPILSIPAACGGFGLLTAIVSPLVLILITLTIIGIPITILLAFALFLAVFIGWAAIGSEIGRRISKAFNSQWHIALQTGVGTLILTLVLEAIGKIPCIGWVLPFLISMLGLGAAVLTRLGTREYVEN